MAILLKEPGQPEGKIDEFDGGGRRVIAVPVVPKGANCEEFVDNLAPSTVQATDRACTRRSLGRAGFGRDPVDGRGRLGCDHGRHNYTFPQWAWAFEELISAKVWTR